MKNCPHCQSQSIRKSNFYFIKHSRSKIRRYKCKACHKSFSTRTFSNTYRQQKPYLNQIIYKLLVSGNTQRRTAKLLHCSKNTIAVKLLWLSNHLNEPQFSNHDLKHIQIDEQETIEHTKLKPLTIPVCVSHTYKILGLSVGKIRAKGHLSEISLKKYGPREDERLKALTHLFEGLRLKLHKDPLTITTDSQPMYAGLIKIYFPHAQHIQIISKEHIKKKRELIYTSEVKKVFDPMFAVNQRLAMFRSDIRRLTRRSWCTTKKIENLYRHLLVYQNYNNMELP